jgi:uncharacterized protein YjbI with pentapeptide repeats
MQSTPSGIQLLLLAYQQIHLALDGNGFLKLKAQVESMGPRWLAKEDLVAKTLSGMDLSGMDLRGADLSEANLAGANLSGVNLSGATLLGANLAGANLSRAKIASADLSRALLAGANLSEARLDHASFHQADLQGAKLHNAHLRNVGFREANLSRADLSEAWLIEVSLMEANLDGADLGGAIIDTCDFSDANLQFTNLSNSFTEKSRLQGARCNSMVAFDTRFEHTNFIQAVLTGANLIEAQLIDCDLSWVNLENASLVSAIAENCPMGNANLQNAILNEASFMGCQLMGANFEMARISSASFRNHCNLRRANFYLARAMHVHFRNCNLQLSRFKNADLQYSSFLESDLTGSDLLLSSVDGADFELVSTDFTNHLSAGNLPERRKIMEFIAREIVSPKISPEYAMMHRDAAMQGPLNMKALRGSCAPSALSLSKQAIKVANDLVSHGDRIQHDEIFSEKSRHVVANSEDWVHIAAGAYIRSPRLGAIVTNKVLLEGGRYSMSGLICELISLGVAFADQELQHIALDPQEEVAGEGTGDDGA